MPFLSISALFQRHLQAFVASTVKPSAVLVVFLMLSPVVILRRMGRGFPCHDFGIPFRCVERIQRCILLAQEVSHGFSMHVLDDCLLNLMTERLSKDPKAAAKRRSISLMQSAYMQLGLKDGFLQAASIPPE